MPLSIIQSLTSSIPGWSFGGIRFGLVAVEAWGDTMFFTDDNLLAAVANSWPGEWH